MLANARSHANNTSIALFFMLADQFAIARDTSVFFPIVKAKSVFAADATIGLANIVLTILVTTLADTRAAHQCNICAIRDRALFTRAFCFLVNANARSPIAFRACVFLPLVHADLTACTWNTSATEPLVLAIRLWATHTAGIFPDIVHTGREHTLFWSFVADVCHFALYKHIEVVR